MLFFASLTVVSACNNQESDKNSISEASTELRNSNCFENEFEEVCPNSQVLWDTIVIDSVPGYPPSCTFTLVHQKVECDWTPSAYFYVIGDTKVIDVNCPQYDAEVFDIIDNLGIGTQTLADYMLDLYDKLLKRRGEMLYFQYFSNFTCDSGQGIFTVQWIKSLCNRFCYLELVKSPGSTWVAWPISCGTGCCFTLHEYCWDTNLRKLIVTTSSEQTSSGQCDELSLPPSWCNLSSPCTSRCE